MDMKNKITHECPECGDIFEAKMIKGPGDGSEPLCLDCLLKEVRG